MFGNALASSVVAALIAGGYVAYNNGNTYTAGTQNATTTSGATVTAGGGTFKATNLGNAACRKSTNGRYYDCHQEVTLSNTGACVAAGCGTKSYHVASITKPFTTGSGVIKRVEVNCDNPGISSTLYAAQVATASVLSGTNVLAKKTIGSGTLVVFSTGGLLWSELTPDLRVFAGTRLGVGSSQCMLSVDSNEMYNP